jgi:prenyltransferase beta subunit
MNDELEDSCLSFIIPPSSLISERGELDYQLAPLVVYLLAVASKASAGLAGEPPSRPARYHPR